MARTNIARAGFQYYGPADGQTGIVQPIECVVIDNKPVTYDLYPGDPVIWVAGTGSTPAYVDHSTPAAGIFGVVADIVQYKRSSDSVVVRNGCKYLPKNTRWTNDGDRSIVTVWPAESCLFTIDSTTAAASIGAARSYIGMNVAHCALATASAAANQGLGLSGFSVDITSAAATDTYDWRVIGMEDGPGSNPLAVTGRWIVRANLLFNKAGRRSIVGNALTTT